MGLISIPGIYRNGVIEPQVKLDLPDNTLVQVDVRVMSEDVLAISDELIRSLYGKYADGPSIIDTLLEERALERLREDAKAYRTQSPNQTGNE